MIFHNNRQGVGVIAALTAPQQCRNIVMDPELGSGEKGTPALSIFPWPRLQPVDGTNGTQYVLSLLRATENSS